MLSPFYHDPQRLDHNPGLLGYAVLDGENHDSTLAALLPSAPPDHHADVVYAGRELAKVGPSVVTRNGVPLSPELSQRVWNHSPDGFSWGYHGSRPVQLALALLLDRGVDEKWAARHHQDFKGAVVAGWGIPGNSPAPRSTRGSRGIRMPDARAKRRRQRRQEQLEAADLEKVSGFAVKTHMVTGAAIHRLRGMARGHIDRRADPAPGPKKNH